MLPLCSPSSFFSGQWALQEMSAERTSFPRIRRILFPGKLLSTRSFFRIVASNGSIIHQSCILL